MPNKYDVIIIGAGPAGLLAALETVKAGLKTLLIEKDAQVGQPLNCAEGVPCQSFENILAVRPHWIKSRINRGRLFDPSGKFCELTYIGAGYVIDRPRMEQDLAEDFVRAGGELVLNCRAVKLNKEDDRYKTLETIDDKGQSREIMAGLFIAADGVESTVARLAGIDNRLDINKTNSLLQYHLSGIKVDPEMIEIHLGNKLAPKSYAWVFPRGEGEANVGLGVASIKNEKPDIEIYLDEFIKKRFGQVGITRRACGTCPMYQGREKLALLNLLVAGDAARVLDSLSGAGIVNALLSGKIAGEAVVSFLADKNATLRDLHRLYPGRFLEQKGDELDMYYKIKKVLGKLTDDDFNEMIEALNDFFVEKDLKSFNMIKILLSIIAKRPRLLKLAGHLI